MPDTLSPDACGRGAEAGRANIISLDSGADAATGVGVQMGYSTSVDAAATPPQNLWTAGTSWDLTAPTDSRNTVSIPLAARYYQTGNTITPGKANTKMTVIEGLTHISDAGNQPNTGA